SQKPSINIPNLDKLVHAIIFGIFVLFWWYYLNNKWDYKNLAIIIGTISIMYGVGMEYYQLLFTRREFEYADMLADGMGSILASLYCIRAKKSPYGNRGRNQN
ncbi:MAG: VanZ family protein, partial [Chitinophagaceae bacterium]